MAKPVEIVNLEKILNANVEFSLNKAGKVTTLDLSDLYIADISFLKDFPYLTYLNISSNSISDLSNLLSLKYLENLNISNNPISNITQLKNLKLLKSLWLYLTQVTDVSSLATQTNLEQLILWNNDISDITPLTHLTKLTYLDLSENKISDITALKNLTELRELNLEENMISDITPLKNLKNLKELDLSRNNISDVTVLKDLKNIASLNLSYNNISAFPFLTGPKNLSELYLEENNIKEINELKFVTTIPSLYIRVSRNPFFTENNIILSPESNHRETIVNELKKLKEKQIKIVLPAKVLMLGNHASGKSTLMDYLLQEKLPKTLKKKSDSTHVMQIATMPVSLQKGKLPEAVFYDFGGQDYYHGLYRAFLSNDSINLLAWSSVNDKNQIRIGNKKVNTRDFSRTYWLHQLKYQYDKNKKEKDNEPILLIQTHADDKEHAVRDTFNDKQHNIKNEFFISLKQEDVEKSDTFKSGLDYLENSILELIQEKRITSEQPEWYENFLYYILTQNGAEYTSLSTIQKQYKRTARNKVFLPDDLDQLSKKGLILYYKDDEDLKDIAWLDPTETVRFIHEKVLTKRQVNKGIIAKKTFESKLDEKLLKLLLNQKVIFFDDTDNNYIVPGYLPLTSDDPKMYELLTFDFREPTFTMKFCNFIPMGLINLMVCHYGKNPNKKYYWRDQLFFTDHERKCKVLIKIDFTNLEILVNISPIGEDVNINSVQKDIFRDIIDMYWDIKIGSTRNLIRRTIKATTDPKTNSTETEVIKEYEGTYDLEIKSPQDLFISTDGKRFVHHMTLENKEKTKMKIASYGLKSHMQIQNGKETEIREIDKDTVKEVSSIVYKNFTTNENIKKMKKIFISYSRKDVDFKNELKKHLNILKTFEIADNWSCEEITIGKWDSQIQKELEESDLIIYMLSANFFSSKYILEKEVQKGMDLITQNNDKNVLCVIVSNFVGIDKLKSAVTDRNEMHDALFKLSEYQYLPYFNVPNSVTLQNEEKIVPLKNSLPNIEDAMEQITSKVLEYVKK